jgi:curved DNA-binding protein CbpA
LSEDDGSGGAAPELDALDYYTLLGIERDADRAEVRAAFRRFALRYHPDRFAGEPPERQARALAIYRRGAEAVDVLGDAEQRAAYDAVLGTGEKRLTDDAVATLKRMAKPAAKAPPPAPKPAKGASLRPPPGTSPGVLAAGAMPSFAKPGAGVRGSRPRPARTTKTSRRAMPAIGESKRPRTVPPPPSAPQIKSPQARAFLQRAMDAKAEGDLRAAWRMLKAAVEAEPGNVLLEKELYAVERTFRG